MRRKINPTEEQITKVLRHQEMELNQIKSSSDSSISGSISETEELLKRLGYAAEIEQTKNHPTSLTRPQRTIAIPSWEELCATAEQEVSDNVCIEEFFTPEELKNNSNAIRYMNQDFNNIYKLDKYDIAISALAGIIAGAVDVLLVGIPGPSTEGVKARQLSDFIRERFNKAFPAEEMEKLANSKLSKVPFDAQDNRNTLIRVEGLSAYYHRLLSLGHDPVLGFVVGVFDIMNGSMTTIDKNGKLVIQIMENYSDRVETNLFAALAKQVMHLKSDITTSMGLPAPLMGLFDLLQFGSIGEENQTIAEIVQGMYYEGYDFIHFASMSIPMMITEVVIRLGYALKRVKEGHPIKESIPISLNREKNPKLPTMLFIGHSAFTAINAGKVYFTKNPCAINYPEWIAFAKYCAAQLKWMILDKPELQSKYVSGLIFDEFLDIYHETDELLTEMEQDYNIVFQ